jgi:uncharacterized protein YfaS (alpha-2-macroglobulin family)
MQRHNGSLAMWPDASEGWTYASLYAAHFVTLAEQAGYKVPRSFSDRLFTFVRSVLNESADEPDTLENQAYACYVLALAGKIDQADRVTMERLTQVISRPVLTPDLTPHAPTRFYLSAAWLAIQHRTRADALIPNSLPSPRAGRQLSGNIGSPVSDRALILSTLMTVNPNHPSLPQLVMDLAELGRTGQWRSTRDTALSLVALAQYQRLTKDLKPYATATLYRGDEVIATAAEGKELTWQSDPGQLAGKLTLKVDGDTDARGFVSWIQTGVPMKPPADETSRGITVRRRLLSPDDGKEIDTARLASGQLIRVELTVTAPHDLDCVVVEDLLPAGLEIENPRLKTAARIDRNEDEVVDPKKVRDLDLDSAPDIRDDRIVLFSSVQTGSQKYEYLARAITPGTFAVPPVRAECMYDLSTFSLTGSGTMTVTAEKPVPVAKLP